MILDILTRLTYSLTSVAVLAFPVSGHAEILFNCGASSGWAHYNAGPVIPADKAGWHEDGISGGRIQLVSTGDSFDLIQVDAAGILSARSNGGEVRILDITDTSATVVVNYRGTTKEFYTFDTSGKLYWSQHKFGGSVEKLAAFIADCNDER